MIVDDYLPESIKVAAKMMHELAIEFDSRNHEVTVITPGIGIGERYSLTKLGNITVLKFYSGQIKNVSKFKRLINEILLPWRAWVFLKEYFMRNKHDYIVYYSPSIFWSCLIGRLKKLWGAPSYLILRDLFPQWVIDNGIIGKNSMIAHFFRYFEKINYSMADQIGIQSPANLKWFLSNQSRFPNIQVLYNWGSDLQFKGKSDIYRKSLNLENKVVYFYGGNLGKAQGMTNIVSLAKRMQVHSKAYFVLVGAGDEVAFIKESIEAENIRNISLLDPVSQDEYRKMLSEFDVGLFTLSSLHQTHNFPGKILGYMVEGKPILGSVNSGNDLQGIIQDAQAGLVSISGDDDLFYENAVTCLDDEKRKEFGKNSKNLLERRFSTRSAADTILSSYPKKNI